MGGENQLFVPWRREWRESSTQNGETSNGFATRTVKNIFWSFLKLRARGREDKSGKISNRVEREMKTATGLDLRVSTRKQLATKRHLKRKSSGKSAANGGGGEELEETCSCVSKKERPGSTSVRSPDSVESSAEQSESGERFPFATGGGGGNIENRRAQSQIHAQMHTDSHSITTTYNGRSRCP